MIWGYLAMGGQIIDSTAVSKQRDAEVEKTAIKEGRVPEAWQAKPSSYHITEFTDLEINSAAVRSRALLRPSP